MLDKSIDSPTSTARLRTGDAVTETHVFTGTKTVKGGAPFISFSNVLTIPPGTVTQWMVHPVQVFIYVLEGTLTVEFATDGSHHKCDAGHAFLQTRYHWHRGRNDGNTPVRLLGVFVGAEDVPGMVHPPSGKVVQA